VDQDFNGEAVLSKGYTTGLLEQEPVLDNGKTVREVVEEGAAAKVALLREYNEISEKFSDPEADMEALLESQGVLQDQIDTLDCWDLDAQLEQAMDALRCPEPDTPIAVLSGGERRRVALCRLLLQKPDILLLDEPTNHLDAESVAWLELHLQRYEGTVIAVTHDRYFLDHVAEWILELDRGEGIPWKGNYSSWLEQKQARLALEEKGDHKREKTLERELEWIRMSPKGQHAKSKARISSFETLLSQENAQREKDLEIFIPAGPFPNPPSFIPAGPFPNPPATDTYWAGSYFIKGDHPTGTLPWTVTVTDAAGNTVNFTPIGQNNGLSVLTIAEKAPAPPKS